MHKLCSDQFLLFYTLEKGGERLRLRDSHIRWFGIWQGFWILWCSSLIICVHTRVLCVFLPFITFTLLARSCFILSGFRVLFIINFEATWLPHSMSARIRTKEFIVIFLCVLFIHFSSLTILLHTLFFILSCILYLCPFAIFLISSPSALVHLRLQVTKSTSCIAGPSLLHPYFWCINHTFFWQKKVKSWGYG